VYTHTHTHTHTHDKDLCPLLSLGFFLKIYLFYREKEREHVSRGRDRGREKISSRLPDECRIPPQGSIPDPEIMT